MLPPIGVIQVNVGCLNDDLAPIGHSIFGVDHQVHDDLFDLSSIGASVAHPGSQSCREFDVLANQRAQQALHIRNDGVQIHYLQFQQLLAAEGEQLPGQGSRPIGGLLNSLRLVMQHVIGVQVFQQNFGITADNQKQVVEVMGYAACQRSEEHTSELQTLRHLVC